MVVVTQLFEEASAKVKGLQGLAAAGLNLN